MVNDRETDFQIAEFFVMYKYRRKSVGQHAFYKTLNLHQGRWQLKCHPNNLPSVYFWDKTIAHYTKGHYEQITSYPGTEYNDGTLGNIFFFES